MKSECLPFGQIPHTTRLFTDFLSNHPKVQQFFPRSAHFAEWLRDEGAIIQYPSERRRQVSDVLDRQNRAWGASAKTLENVNRLRGGAAAAVTGQQVGLFGGPLFSLYKALTAIKLADLATQSGVDCVPVFWLATEDHDLEEVNHVSIPGPDATLLNLMTPTQATAGGPVATAVFGNEIQGPVDMLGVTLGDSEITAVLRECYQPGENFGSAFARLFARIFADWGVILLNASDPMLHHVAEPMYRAAVERVAELDDALLARGRELEAAGYHQQVKVTPSSSLLFTLRNGARVPVHRRINGETQQIEFTIEDEKISQPELLQRIASAPQQFSANVLLRPVVQDFLLPTLTYTGGSAEVAYFAQAAVVYEKLLGRVTPIVPRFSATIVEPKLRGLLDRYQLSLPDLFHGPEPLQERLAASTLPGELQSAFDSAEAGLKTSLAAIRGALAHLDKTLVDAAENSESKMHHQLEGLRTRAARAELRQTEVLGRHAALLSHALFPNKSLQERELAGIYFLSRYGNELLHHLYDSIYLDCPDHQVISV